MRTEHVEFYRIATYAKIWVRFHRGFSYLDFCPPQRRESVALHEGMCISMTYQEACVVLADMWCLGRKEIPVQYLNHSRRTVTHTAPDKLNHLVNEAHLKAQCLRSLKDFVATAGASTNIRFADTRSPDHPRTTGAYA